MRIIKLEKNILSSFVNVYITMCSFFFFTTIFCLSDKTFLKNIEFKNIGIRTVDCSFEDLFKNDLYIKAIEEKQGNLDKTYFFIEFCDKEYLIKKGIRRYKKLGDRPRYEKVQESKKRLVYIKNRYPQIEAICADNYALYVEYICSQLKNLSLNKQPLFFFTINTSDSNEFLNHKETQAKIKKQFEVNLNTTVRYYPYFLTTYYNMNTTGMLCLNFLNKYLIDNNKMEISKKTFFWVKPSGKNYKMLFSVDETFYKNLETRIEKNVVQHIESKLRILAEEYLKKNPKVDLTLKEKSNLFMLSLFLDIFEDEKTIDLNLIDYNVDMLGMILKFLLAKKNSMFYIQKTLENITDKDKEIILEKTYVSKIEHDDNSTLSKIYLELISSSSVDFHKGFYKLIGWIVKNIDSSKGVPKDVLLIFFKLFCENKKTNTKLFLSEDIPVTNLVKNVFWDDFGSSLLKSFIEKSKTFWIELIKTNFDHLKHPEDFSNHMETCSFFYLYQSCTCVLNIFEKDSPIRHGSISYSFYDYYKKSSVVDEPVNLIFDLETSSRLYNICEAMATTPKTEELAFSFDVLDNLKNIENCQRDTKKSAVFY
ncbi:hypothetical protein NGRA_0931 [Nosema granulosis]|uniref:Uncharacterized protein n=1 Tax=Nosema granulosis TaxID=83296 RepID=A0A9P6GZE1_9MICR|nr:hypothetical protein NGRA_0931 [Nosema granulosis]